ncbi:hypothetical protein GYMLUDRAFT_100545 [Collybiopsis luxurians FD-317 M1]|uniref:ABM domain-containing protein n=1 Tax=Collybiopsis luxurians FD-317 M1 TaxID=944289 RepID=A0A0D0C5B4_9AGAR|nr:hypothetical protein GYMLUDRAFT_100545 [Collybiopsis luxurians FD-317 M1]
MATGVKVIQCTAFEASNEYINNRGQYADAFAKIAHVEGHISSYWGLQVPEEGAKKGLIVTVWESSAHYNKFVGSDTYNSGVSSLKSAAVGELKRAQFTGVVGTPIPGLSAAVTEVVLVRPNAGVTADHIKDAAHKLYAAFESNGRPSALGVSTDQDGLYIVLVGWSSVSESRETVKKEPFASAIAAFSTLASQEITHATLDKHT